MIFSMDSVVRQQFKIFVLHVNPFKTQLFTYTSSVQGRLHLLITVQRPTTETALFQHVGMCVNVCLVDFPETQKD